jgi:hypothetical protein
MSESIRVVPLERLRMRDLAQVGGKNASLGEMIGELHAAGIRVPGGFATTADAFREFLQQDSLGSRIEDQIRNLDVGDVRALANAGATIRGWIAATTLPKALVDDIERGYREFGIDFFYLWGDTVTLNVKSFTAFCDELIARNLPIQWFGNARADNLTDPAFVHRLRKAGCWMLALGIETESEDIRKNMVKRLERQKIQTAFRNMREAGIRSFAFFIFGYPGETIDTMDHTVDYAIELDPDFANFYPAVPYPGTALYAKAVQEGWLVEEDWSRMEYSFYLMNGNGLDERVVFDAINRAKRRFFLRPSYVARRLGDVVKLMATKPAIVRQVLARAIFGTRGPAPAPPAEAVSPGGAARI